MEITIKRFDEVWTADEQKLGAAEFLYHRTTEVDSEVEYYESYLEVQNYELGDDYYVPSDFIVERDEASGRVLLSVTMQQVLKRTWSRLPTFVAKGDARKEALPEAGEGSPGEESPQEA